MIKELIPFCRQPENQKRKTSLDVKIKSFVQTVKDQNVVKKCFLGSRSSYSSIRGGRNMERRRNFLKKFLQKRF